MKITIVLGAFLPVPPIMGGAVEKVWFALSQEFARRCHEVVFVSRALPELPRSETRDGVRHLRVRGFDTPRSLLWLKFLDLIYSIRTMSILSAIRTDSSSGEPAADIIVTNTFWLPILLRNAKRGQVYVHVARYPKGQMRFYGNAARLQAPSRAVARAVAAETPKLAQKITVIPYPAPRSTSEIEPPPFAEREKTILFVGRVHSEKGVHLLLAAFANAARTIFADWKLVIIGPTEKKYGGGGGPYLAALARTAEQAQDKIIFRGPLFDPIALEREFRSARLFVYPSLAEKGESFGLAPLEAMAHRCAVLVSNLDCFHDFIREGETGFVFDHRAANPSDALREKIENALADETLLARVAEAGYRKSAEFSLAKVADQFLNDFNSLVRNSDAPTTGR
ncbi:MAG TPA: glycosyltransferase family 4 protein [Chthoniobacterales bacterium]|nr:glycosyltransferase family 4 protein [Chthoniobacterales bacterium]